MSLHRRLTIGNIHYIQNWSFANEAARLAYNYKPTDVGKVAFQTSDNTFWIISSINPVVFVQLGVNSELTSTIVGGVDVDGYFHPFLLNDDGSIATPQKTERFEKITSGITDTIYMGSANPGSLESDFVWSITKVSIVNNFPISILVSEPGVSWDDRLTIDYL